MAEPSTTSAEMAYSNTPATICGLGTATTGKSRTATHYRHDAAFREDDSRTRARQQRHLQQHRSRRFFHSGFRDGPEANLHFHDATPRRILQPD